MTESFESVRAELAQEILPAFLPGEDQAEAVTTQHTRVVEGLIAFGASVDDEVPDAYAAYATSVDSYPDELAGLSPEERREALIRAADSPEAIRAFARLIVGLQDKLPEWYRDAACRGAGAEAFTLERPIKRSDLKAFVELARRIYCDNCSVMDKCALASRDLRPPESAGIVLVLGGRAAGLAR